VRKFMSKNKQSLGELELEVLKIVSQLQPCTVSQIIEIMNKRRGSARTTILTVIQRLENKRFVTRRKIEGIFNYRTTSNISAVLIGLTKQFIDTMLDGSPVPFVTYLAESKGLTKKQVETLQAIAKELDKETENEE
jgi:predicted transcriptional regulator